jgi:hypothetical protein
VKRRRHSTPELLACCVVLTLGCSNSTSPSLESTCRSVVLGQELLTSATTLRDYEQAVEELRSAIAALPNDYGSVAASISRYVDGAETIKALAADYPGIEHFDDLPIEAQTVAETATRQLQSAAGSIQQFVEGNC